MNVAPLPQALRRSAKEIAAVEDRRIEFSPALWRKQLDRFGVQTTAITDLSYPTVEGELATITREALITYANSRDLTSRQGRRDAFVAAMVWGGGPPRRRGRQGGDSRAPWRIATALSSERFGDPDLLLQESIDAVRDGELVAAYYSATRLHWVNGAFATKWLWLVGELYNADPQPLVWDSVIVAWLNQNSPGLASKRASPARTKNDADRYRDYVRSLAAWASELQVAGGASKLEAYIFAAQQYSR